MLRPFGPALSVIYADASRALSRKQEPPADYITARYPAQPYKHVTGRPITALLIGEARHIIDVIDDLPVHKRMFTHYSQTNKVHECNIILDAPTAVLHITVISNEANNDTLVLRTELLA
jgi:hypothetical protein